MRRHGQNMPHKGTADKLDRFSIAHTTTYREEKEAEELDAPSHKQLNVITVTVVQV